MIRQKNLPLLIICNLCIESFGKKYRENFHNRAKIRQDRRISAVFVRKPSNNPVITSTAEKAHKVKKALHAGRLLELVT